MNFVACKKIPSLSGALNWLKQATWKGEHVKMDGKRYNITKGMWNPHEKMWILPRRAHQLPLHVAADHKPGS